MKPRRQQPAPLKSEASEQPSEPSSPGLITQPQVSAVSSNNMSNNPDSYTAYAFTEKNGKLQKVTVPWKDPEKGEIVVKVLACGVCGRFVRQVLPMLSITEYPRFPLRYSDHFVQEQTIPTGLPRVPGHEIIGTVAAIHPTETVYKLGDRVGSGWHGGHCFECDMCLEGNFSQCRKQTVNGMRFHS